MLNHRKKTAALRAGWVVLTILVHTFFRPGCNASIWLGLGASYSFEL
jgi:hypothetical protein